MNRETTFGSIVKERRYHLGLTQAELARRASCAAITIRKIEADAMRPSVQIAEQLAVALNIPEEEIVAFTRLARADPDPSSDESEASRVGAIMRRLKEGALQIAIVETEQAAAIEIIPRPPEFPEPDPAQPLIRWNTGP